MAASWAQEERWERSQSAAPEEELTYPYPGSKLGQNAVKKTPYYRTSGLWPGPSPLTETLSRRRVLVFRTPIHRPGIALFWDPC